MTACATEVVCLASTAIMGGGWHICISQPDDHGNLGTLFHEVQNAASVIKLISSVCCHQQHIGVGLLNQNVPHEVKASLSRCAIKMQRHVGTKLQPPKVKGNGRFRF